jgi:hypothetical protein
MQLNSNRAMTGRGYPIQMRSTLGRLSVRRGNGDTGIRGYGDTTNEGQSSITDNSDIYQYLAAKSRPAVSQHCSLWGGCRSSASTTLPRGRRADLLRVAPVSEGYLGRQDLLGYRLAPSAVRINHRGKGHPNVRSGTAPLRTPQYRSAFEPLESASILHCHRRHRDDTRHALTDGKRYQPRIDARSKRRND